MNLLCIELLSPRRVAGEIGKQYRHLPTLAGYTAWGQQLDAEEVHALLEQFFDRADLIIQEHGGRIDKHIGDCVMGLRGSHCAR